MRGASREIGLTLRTVSHLSPNQIWHRLRLTARRRLWERMSARVDAGYRRRAAALPPARFDHPGLARVAALRLRSRDPGALRRVAEDARLGRFTFLGRSENMGVGVQWYRANLDVGTRLWKTHLHEFPYALALSEAGRAPGGEVYRARLMELVESWERASPIGRPGFALDAWNARAVATRLVNWALAGSRLSLEPGSPEARQLSRALAVQGLFLRDNLELDLRGNHLLRDAVGLVFVEELFGTAPDALGWLERQVDEQVLPDGCHVERAPMYHALCLQDLLEARLLLGEAAPTWLDDALGRMAGLLEAIRLGDGEIPLLGDGWLGEIDTGVLLDAVREVALPVEPDRPERHGGLMPLRAGALKAVVRAGAHGPDYLLGHAHADLLSFDLSLGDRRVVTDTGTSLYDPGPERQHLRSTLAHNTLRIDGCEQLEAWASFRVGRRGRATVQAVGAQGTWRWLAASHDAYRGLPGRPIHHRLLAVCERGVVVLDAVTGAGRHRIESALNEHPERPKDRIELLALAGAAEPHTTPLHEHFGESRAMTQHRLEAETELPWVGGWLAWCTDGESVAPPVRFEGELHMLADTVELTMRSPLTLEARWTIGTENPEEAVVLRLCPPAPGSAT